MFNCLSLDSFLTMRGIIHYRQQHTFKPNQTHRNSLFLSPGARDPSLAHYQRVRKRGVRERLFKVGDDAGNEERREGERHTDGRKGWGIIREGAGKRRQVGEKGGEHTHTRRPRHQSAHSSFPPVAPPHTQTDGV